ncbi:MAG: efflux RND transporter periplasmic adaptor subunit [Spirochaetota bacterium]|nr:efflux RND transporter periplasmic adaptor subunit [Spirochaetota bacterium]
MLNRISFTKVAILSFFVIAGCGGEKKKAAKVEEILPLVRIAKVELMDAYDKLNLVGEVQGENEAIIFPDVSVSGVIRSIKVDEGDVVKEGDPLMEIDRKAVTGNDFRPFIVRARMSGVVTHVYVQNGVLAGPQTKLCQIVQMKRLKVALDIPERQIGKVIKGQDVKIESQSYPGKVFNGKISQLYPSVDPRTLTLRAEVTLANSDQKLKPGMFTQTEIVLKRKKAVLIPLNALIIEDNVPYVYIYNPKEKKVSQRIVKKGSFYENMIEIPGGLKVGEMIVVEGQYQVTDQDKVKVVKEKGMP